MRQYALLPPLRSQEIRQSGLEPMQHRPSLLSVSLKAGPLLGYVVSEASCYASIARRLPCTCWEAISPDSTVEPLFMRGIELEARQATLAWNQQVVVSETHDYFTRRAYAHTVPILFTEPKEIPPATTTITVPAMCTYIHPLPPPAFILPPKLHRAAPATPLPQLYMRKTPKFVGSTGAHAAAESARLSRSRVCEGSIKPSSHRRAVAYRESASASNLERISSR